MTGKTLTLHLGGNVPLSLFAQSIQHFRQLIESLSQEVSAKSEISWIVDELAAGSAEITIRGNASRAEDVMRVQQAYAVVGHALERHQLIPYSPKVADAARKLTSLLNGQITSMRFETETDTLTITSGAQDQTNAYFVAFGAVEGRIETLRSRRRLSFTLYDALNDRAVYCTFRADQAELVRDAWGKSVIVEGWVKREPINGRPVEITTIESISVIPDVLPGSYRRARAIAPAGSDAPSTETVLRRSRDA